MVKSIIGWILATASLLLGLLVFVFVISVLPLGPVAGLAAQVLTGVGWLFGTALPAIGDIALDAARREFGDGNTISSPTTTIP